MTELIALAASCRRCGVTLLAADDDCWNCGLPNVVSVYADAPTELADSEHAWVVVPSCPPIVAPRRRQSLVAEVLDNRLFVIAILLCAGPIGLPALWFSHRFSRRSKIIVTAGYFLFTVILPLAIAWYFLDVALRPVVDALGELGGGVLPAGAEHIQI